MTDLKALAEGLSEAQWAAMKVMPDHCGCHPYRCGVPWGTAKAIARLGLGEAIQIDRYFKPNDTYFALRAYLESNRDG